MAEKTVTLDEESSAILDQFLDSGVYPDQATAILQAFRALQKHNQDYDEKLQVLRFEIDKGMDGGVVEGDPFERIRVRHGWPARVAR